MRQSRETYDVCIVGSGAGGGMAAYALTQAGANVVMLEAGGWWDNSKDSAMFKMTADSPRRGASTKERPFGEFDGCIGGWDLDGEPYTQADNAGFRWWRARMLGGRTNHWGRISLRFGPDDFRRGELDGLSPNWPITYDDIKPYYDKVDRFIGVFGSNEGIPNSPDGIFLPPPRPRAYELLVKHSSDKLGVPCIPARLSILTKPLPGRAPCHYCAECNRGCAVNANFSSPNVLIIPAQKTKRLTVITNAMAREVTVGSDGKATGVSYVDKTTGQDRHVNARVVVLAASALESARILMNSKSSQFPNGLANASGMLGKQITDTTGSDYSAFIPDLVDLPVANEDGVGGGHVYMPWWGDNKKLDFPRGYHIEVYGGRGMPGSGFMGNIQNYRGSRGGGYGVELKNEYRRFWGTSVGFSGRGEMIPNKDCYCEIDPTGVKDKWGIPVLRFHWKFSDYEYNQVKHMQQTFRDILAGIGATVSPMPTRERSGYGIAAGGQIIHELGGTPMGASASTGVLNGNCQSWECKNLFVADGGPFPSQADKNPTWTILALSWRTADYITQQRKAGAL